MTDDKDSTRYGLSCSRVLKSAKNYENIVLTILVVIKKFRLPNKKFSVLDNRPYNLNSMITTMIELKVFDGRVPVDDKLVVAGIVGKDMGLGQLP